MFLSSWFQLDANLLYCTILQIIPSVVDVINKVKKYIPFINLVAPIEASTIKYKMVKVTNTINIILINCFLDLTFEIIFTLMFFVFFKTKPFHSFCQEIRWFYCKKINKNAKGQLPCGNHPHKSQKPNKLFEAKMLL